MPRFTDGGTEAQRVGDVAQVVQPASLQRLDWNPCWFYFQSNVLYTVLPKQSHNFACCMSMGEKFTLNGSYWSFFLSFWSFAFLRKVMGTLLGLFPPRPFRGVLAFLMSVGSQVCHLVVGGKDVERQWEEKCQMWFWKTLKSKQTTINNFLNIPLNMNST